MASDLRKGVAIGPAGTTNGGVHDYRVQKRYFDDTNTPWVRLWAPWPHLQPSSGDSVGGHGNWAGLDAQVQEANRNGRAVIVTAWKFPLWANGAARGGYTGQNDDLFVPDSVAMGSPWSIFIQELIVRYNPAFPNNKGFAACVEICNEPNVQWRPQTNIHNITADMMRVAAQIKVNWGIQSSWPVLLAPGTGDTTEVSDFRTPYSTFMDRVLDNLKATNFRAGGWFGWSHHNHRDIELDAGIGGSITTTNRAKVARDKLRANNRWYGWGSENDPANARMFLTEGAGRLNTIHSEWYPGQTYDRSRARNKQRDLLVSNHNRMQNTADGAGIAMLMHYLFTSDYNYDCGLRDAYTYSSVTESR
jgi:hypothetical protein